MSELKDLRIRKKLTQREAAVRTGVSLRSYISYENDETKRDTIKYRYLVNELENINPVDEEHGLISIGDIRKACAFVFNELPVEFCWLFGSYAKGTATETSDVDLLISTDITGLRFYGLTESLRECLHKNIDLLDLKQLLNNEALLKEVLRDGIKVYG